MNFDKDGTLSIVVVSINLLLEQKGVQPSKFYEMNFDKEFLTVLFGYAEKRADGELSDDTLAEGVLVKILNVCMAQDIIEDVGVLYDYIRMDVLKDHPEEAGKVPDFSSLCFWMAV